jgi:hypothetical protein
MHLRETGCEVVDWVCLAQDRDFEETEKTHMLVPE